MFLPLGTEHARRRPTLITYVIMALCVLVFLIQKVMEANATPQNPWGGYIGFMLWPPNDLPGWPPFHVWQLFTYQFLHGDWMHLLGNMLFLWVFGPPVEDRLRRWGFLGFYLIAGVAAGLLHMAFEASPVLGASGSISGVTGAFLILFPLVGVRILLFFFLIGVYTIPAWWFIGAAVAYDMAFAAANDGVARLAHIGGYLYGAGVAMILLWLKVLPREPFDLFSMGRQAYRRRQFKELSQRHTAWTHEPGAPVLTSKRRREPRTIEPTGHQREALEARRRVTDAMTAGDLNGACDAYAKLLDCEADATMPAEQQIDIANHAMQAGKHQLAAAAYELFLKRYAADHRTTEVRLMLALVNARYLNDPTRAQQVLRDLPGSLREQDEALRDALLEELG